MREVVLEVDATFGLKVQAGDRVQRGDEIGIKAGTSEVLTAAVSGTVKGVAFDAASHTFEVRLEPDY
jgi:Na+-translocating ferredoxin:NAD+ oxidoreductase RnfC subunit